MNMSHELSPGLDPYTQKARGGRGRGAAVPSPPVQGPAACSRKPRAAAFWRRAVASHAMSRFCAFVRPERCSAVCLCEKFADTERCSCTI